MTAIATDSIGKEPWLAVTLSRIIPGAGQIYAGYRVRGGILLGLTVLLTGLGLGLIVSPEGSIQTGVMLLFLLVVLSIWNWFDAYGLAKQRNSEAFESLRRQGKDPWLAVFLSLLFPGLGHAYLKKWLFCALWIALAIVLGILPMGLSNLAGFFLSLGVAYHAYHATTTRRETSSSLLLRVLSLFLAITLLSAGAALFIRVAIAEARYIVSESMSPTLEIGDRLIINKQIYRTADPQRTDIVLYSPTPALLEIVPKATYQYLHRVIALPGETLEIREGTVWINGSPLQEDYLLSLPEYQWGPETVPANSYFVLGDNRNNSLDGHIWGFLPRENMIGKAVKIFWTPQRSRVL